MGRLGDWVIGGGACERGVECENAKLVIKNVCCIAVVIKNTRK